MRRVAVISVASSLKLVSIVLVDIDYRTADVVALESDKVKQ